MQQHLPKWLLCKSLETLSGIINHIYYSSSPKTENFVCIHPSIYRKWTHALSCITLRNLIVFKKDCYWLLLPQFLVGFCFVFFKHVQYSTLYIAQHQKRCTCTDGFLKILKILWVFKEEKGTNHRAGEPCERGGGKKPHAKENARASVPKYNKPDACSGFEWITLYSIKLSSIFIVFLTHNWLQPAVRHLVLAWHSSENLI